MKATMGKQLARVAQPRWLMVLSLLLLSPQSTEAFRPSPLSRSPAASRSPVVTIQPTRKSSIVATKTPATTSSLRAASAADFLTNTDVYVFVAGIFPFLWATYEFWRRIMFGESFGTGTDRVIIGMDDSPRDSRGTRVLGKGALITAYVLFVIAFGTLGVVGYSVVTSEAPSPEALAASAAAASAAGGDGL